MRNSGIKCPNCPESTVVDAKTPGSIQRVLICLTCGEKLGEAPPRNVGWESFSYVDSKKD